MKSKNKKRIIWLDMAKGYGILCVIAAHLGIPYLNKWIYTFHMPLFFFLSGYVFSQKSCFKEFIFSKIKTIFIPYFCLGTIMSIFIVLYGKVNYYNVISDLLNVFKLLILQQRWWALWFLACLFLLNILYYILIKIIKNMKLLSVVVFCLAVLGLIYYKLGGTSLYWNADVCFLALPFFHIGYLFRKKQTFEKYLFDNKYKILLIFLFLIINVVMGYVGYYLSGDILEMYGNTYGCVPLTYLAAFAGILLIILLSNLLTIKPISYIGQNSLIYFAWHQPIMMPLISDFYKKIGLFQNVPLPFYEKLWMVILSVIIICIVLTLVNILFRKTFLKYMIGK